jgi:hypothetical protein
MKSIVVEYPFFKWTRKATGSFPERWEELTPEQITLACKVSNEDIPEVLFLSLFSGISKRIVRKLGALQRYKLMELVSFVRQPKPYHKFIIRSVKKFVSPRAGLEGVNFSQFIFADSYFSLWQNNNSDTDLNKFVASLYLHKNEKFADWIPREREKVFSKIPHATREAIAMNYILIREWLEKSYPLIFVKYEEQEQENKKRSKKNKGVKGDGWIQVFESLVGDDIINRDKYAELPVHSVFRYMTKSIKENSKKKR